MHPTLLDRSWVVSAVKPEEQLVNLTGVLTAGMHFVPSELRTSKDQDTLQEYATWAKRWDPRFAQAKPHLYPLSQKSHQALDDLHDSIQESSFPQG